MQCISVSHSRKAGRRNGILGSFLQYAIIMVILAAIALAGFFAGKKLRENKDAKAAAEADTAAEQEVK